MSLNDVRRAATGHYRRRFKAAYLKGWNDFASFQIVRRARMGKGSASPNLRANIVSSFILSSVREYGLRCSGGKLTQAVLVEF